MTALLRNVRVTLEMIKIEHTLFALPFAFLGAVLAANGMPTIRQIFWITIAMVGARSTAMAFNRIADRDYDAQNPRTQTRAIPGRTLVGRFCLAVYPGLGGAFLVGRGDAEPADVAAGANRAGERNALFVLETLDAALSFVSWLVFVDCADRRVDSGARPFGQSGATVAFVDSAFVDRGFRRSLCLPGL